MDNFDDIRPYYEDEVAEAYFRLMEDKRFQDAVAKCLPNYTVDDLRKDFPNFHSTDDIQASFIRRWIETFTHQSSKGQTFSGMDNLDPNKAYLFISNHRDITFDPAMLEYYCFLLHRRTTRIAAGDNLMRTPVLGEVARLNKMFLVKRSGTLREKLVNFKQLSAYIQHSVLEDNESVWIAQRDGRTKDGYDYTKQGLVKMLTMGYEKELIPTIKRLRITPMAISYEYEPCDRQKAREMALSENGPYKKQPGEDFDSIKHGIFDNKGHITLVVGTPLDAELDDIPANLSINDKLYQVCHLIDKQIYQNYKLYATNYIANDLMHGQQRYTEFYTPEEKNKFEAYLQQRAVVQDVSKDKMMHYLLGIYGIPVDNHYEFPKNQRQ